jgi:hypothetical protein
LGRWTWCAFLGFVFLWFQNGVNGPDRAWSRMILNPFHVCGMFYQYQWIDLRKVLQGNHGYTSNPGVTQFQTVDPLAEHPLK